MPFFQQAGGALRRVPGEADACERRASQYGVSAGIRPSATVPRRKLP